MRISAEEIVFAASCAMNREAIYGLLAKSAAPGGGAMLGTGSAFMVAPGYLITAAHCVHQDGDVSKPLHSGFQVVRAPDVGNQMEIALLKAEDPVKDIALLQIAAPRSTASLRLHTTRVAAGTPVGSLGFPLATIDQVGTGIRLNLFERFQGANLSSYLPVTRPGGVTVHFYETDSLMYPGSSGCPGFIATGEVFGLHNGSQVDKPDPAAGASPGAPAAPAKQTRLAISHWVPAVEIEAFVLAQGVKL